MNHPRSIRARLITLYVVTLTVIFVCFGGYTYWGFKQYLVRSLREALSRRAHQIAQSILAEVPQRGEAYIGSEIQARYAPELNERIIRVTDQSGRLVYASRNATALQTPPGVTFTEDNAETRPVAMEKDAGAHERLQIMAVGYRLPDGKRYIVEVGAGENDISSALSGLLLTLSLGFPVFIGLTSVGAYLLLGRALRPVDEIVRSAERITLQNLSQRLPVPHTGDEVERLSIALNRMIQRLDESYQVTSRFSADASHELRTPITIMRGELEGMLNEGGYTEEQVAQIGSLLEEAERLTQIVEGLLTISRLDAGEPRTDKDPVDLQQVARTTVEQMLPLAEDRSLALTCETDGPLMVEANEVRLKQVIVNLLDNAIKYTPQGGRISVRVLSDTSHAILEVEDNGIGIAPEALPHVFERFYRSEQPLARQAGGTGLGLSMVQSIVDSHNGKVTVLSREGHGSVFRVRIPRLDLHLAQRI